MMSVFFWVAFGAVIGWVEAILQDETASRRVLALVAVGAAGGLLGGFGGLLVDPSVTPYRSDTTDIIFAIFGATAAVFVVGLAADRHSSE